MSGGAGMSSSERFKRVQSGSPYEAQVGFCRALRAGDRILVAGTAPIGKDGQTVGKGDAYAQAHRCIEIIGEAIGALGGRLEDVVRTRIFITRRDNWDGVAIAHGEVFDSIRPVATCVVVSGLLDPDWLVELEAEADLSG